MKSIFFYLLVYSCYLCEIARYSLLFLTAQYHTFLSTYINIKYADMKRYLRQINAWTEIWCSIDESTFQPHTDKNNLFSITFLTSSLDLSYTNMFDIWETTLFEMELYYCFNVYINSIYPHRISSHRTASGTPVKSSQKRKITKESRRRQKSSSANSQK